MSMDDIKEIEKSEAERKAKEEKRLQEEKRIFQELERKHKETEEWCKNEDYQRMLNAGIRLDSLENTLKNKQDLTKEQRAEIEEQIALCEKILALYEEAKPWTKAKTDEHFKEEQKEEILELEKLVETEETEGSFDVEESARLAEFGIIVLNVNKKKLFTRPIRLTKKELEQNKKYGIDSCDLPFSFEPITTDAMRKAKISESLIEESENHQLEENNQYIED
jgi:hypothetical protein